ncbi:hypothetical protein CH273_02230 [Rhodococcus sp. 05-339-2]|nr:hypothetical protein CH273_02230 [Rhodococcus sp. 05-339-2]
MIHSSPLSPNEYEQHATRLLLAAVMSGRRFVVSAVLSSIKARRPHHWMNGLIVKEMEAKGLLRHAGYGGSRFPLDRGKPSNLWICNGSMARIRAMNLLAADGKGRDAR